MLYLQNFTMPNGLVWETHYAHYVAMMRKVILTSSSSVLRGYDQTFVVWAMLGPLAFGTNVDFVNLVVNPSVCLSSPSENPLLQAQTCIQIALTLECIWNLRNQVARSQ